MALLVLKILLVVIALTQGLGKFLAFFLVKKETRMKMVEAMYAKGSGEGSATRLYDRLALVFMFILIGLLFASGMEYISFTAGFVVGLMALQLYLHAFNQPLEKTPPPPLSPVKLFSYALKEMPEKGWVEMLFMTAILLWFLAQVVMDLVQHHF